jgi:uncharacterized protein (TIGR00251 family)
MAASQARWFRRDVGTLTLFVHVQPGARRTEVAGLHGDAIKIRVHAPALEDRANDELIEFIAERLGVARRDVTLVSGQRSRDKKLAIATDCDAMRLLDSRAG